MRIYRALILPIAIYGAESWTLRQADKRQLDTFEMRCLPVILGVSLMDKIRNEEIRQRLHLPTTICDEVSKRRLKWFGHVVRMPPHRLPFQAYKQCSRQNFFLCVSQIRKFGITKIYTCRTLANPEGIAIYRLTRYRYFAHVLSAHAFRNLRYFIQPITQFCDRFPCFASQDRAHHTAHTYMYQWNLQFSMIIIVHRRHFSRISQKR